MRFKILFLIGLFGCCVVHAQDSCFLNIPIQFKVNYTVSESETFVGSSLELELDTVSCISLQEAFQIAYQKDSCFTPDRCYVELIRYAWNNHYYWSLSYGNAEIEKHRFKNRLKRKSIQKNIWIGSSGKIEWYNSEVKRKRNIVSIHPNFSGTDEFKSEKLCAAELLRKGGKL